jgi:hypothetical protein
MISTTVFLFFAVFFLAWAAYYTFEALYLLRKCREDVQAAKQEVSETIKLLRSYRA